MDGLAELKSLVIEAVISYTDMLIDAFQIMKEKGLEILLVQSVSGEIQGVLTKDTLLNGLVLGHSLNQTLAGIHLEALDDYLLGEDADNLINESRLTDRVVIDGGTGQLGIIRKDDVARFWLRYYKRKYKEKEAIFNSALNGIFVLDSKGFITEMNPAAEKITGLIQHKTIGKKPEQRGLPTNYIRVLENGEKAVESRLTHNGRVFIVTRSPIINEGKITGALSVFQDVTEFEDISNKLRKVEELRNQLETVINSSFDGIIVADSNGKILNMNRSAAKLVDLNENAEDLPQWFMALINDVKHKFDAITGTSKSSQGNELIITANPIYNEADQITKIVFNIRDITELMHLKAELLNTRELSQKYLEELDKLKHGKNINLVARSPKMQQVVDLSLRMAEVDTTVLILGETGVGKQLIAKLIHDYSPRKNGPFVDINCGAIPENLLESELFGYEPGTFTGGLKTGKIGLFEQANKGTIFLDEIGDLPYALQVKLLKVLQNQEILRVGALKPRKVDARVIAATNKDLDHMVREGSFRKDLYYRLNIVPINVPPLRERKEDILPLVHFYKTALEERYAKTIDFAPEVYEIFLKYAWPGNVRQLQNIVERLFVTVKGSLIEPDMVFPLFLKPGDSEIMLDNFVSDMEGIIPLKEAIEIVEIKLIKKALKKFGSTYKAAKALGVNQSTISRKAKKLNLD